MNLLLLIFQVLFSILLLFLPLSKYFSYEYSLFSGVFITVLSFIKTVSLLKKRIDKSEDEVDKITLFKKILKSVKSFYFLIFLIPIIIGTVNSLLRGDCPFINGVPFYLLFAIPAISVGRGIGAMSFFISNRFSYLTASFIWLLIASLPIIEIYYYPQVYFYNPIISYFPGNFYDELIQISAKLVFYRLFIFLFFETVYSGCKYLTKYKFRLLKVGYPLVIALIGGTFFYLSSHFGFSSDKELIERVLSEKYATKHFDIYFPQGIDKIQKGIIADQHEFYFNELVRFYDVIPQKRISSFIFSSKEEKGELFGAENADVAKPWLYQIYLSVNSLEATLKHEISHIFTAEFSHGIFKVADGFNPLLIEGIAMASDPMYDNYDINFLVATAYRNGYKVSIKELFSGFSFFSNASSLSYLYSGAFIEFLINKYGIYKVKLFYSDSDTERYFGKSIDLLESDFYKYLESEKIYGSKTLADYYFGRKGLLQKACPRYLALGVDEIYYYLNKRQYRYALESINKYETFFENPVITIAKTVVYEKEEKHREAISLLEKKAESFKNTSYQYYFLLRLADFYSLADDSLKADSIYKFLSSDLRIRNYYYASQVRQVMNKSEISIKHYIQSLETERLILLIDEHKKNRNFVLIPALIDLIEKVNVKNDVKVFSMEEINLIKDSFILYRLSMYYLRIYDLKSALECIEMAGQEAKENISEKKLEEQKGFIKYLLSREKRV